MSRQRGFMSDRPNSDILSDTKVVAPETKRVLDDYLRRISFRSEVFYRGQVCENWSLDISGTGHINFHVVCHGDGWLRMPGMSEPIPLHQGDVVVLPHDSSHLVLSAPGQAAEYGKIFAPQQVPLDRNAAGTALVCGYLIVDRATRGLLFAMLPNYLIVRAKEDVGQDTGSAQFRALIDLLFAEAQANRVGATAVLDRLSDALMFYVIRHAMEMRTQTVGLLAALGDKQIRPALVAICDQPAHAWNVDALAATTFMSRSAFAERFHALIGKAPMEFLTEWRMQLARVWLEQDLLSVAAVSARCGYQSEAAFSKAFKRVTGVGPGEFRRARLPWAKV